MPSDSNGIYSLPSGYLAVTGDTIQASQHNPPLEDLASSMSARLMRSGAAPMTGSLKAVDGAAGTPSVQFANAPSTGFFKTTDGIGIAVGGTQVAEFTSGGLRTGARYIGELIPYSGLTAQALTVFPYGQTLSRTTYATLWAFAQTEIASGNTFYNNGNGTTTFGIGDLRGRVIATKDNLGGSYVNRLGTNYFGADPGVVGAVGGRESHTLTLDQAPVGITSANASQPISVLSNNFLLGNTTSNSGSSPGGGTQLTAADPGSGAVIIRQTSTGNNSISVTSNNTSGLAHNNVQPTMICTHLLFAGA